MEGLQGALNFGTIFMRMLILMINLLSVQCVTARLNEFIEPRIEKDPLTTGMKIREVRYGENGGFRVIFSGGNLLDKTPSYEEDFSDKQPTQLLETANISLENPHIFPTGSGELVSSPEGSGYASKMLMMVDLKACSDLPAKPNYSPELIYLVSYLKVNKVYLSTDCRTIFFAESKDIYVASEIKKCETCKASLYLDQSEISPALLRRIFGRYKGPFEGTYRYPFDGRYPRSLPKPIPKGDGLQIWQMSRSILEMTLIQKDNPTNEPKYQTVFYVLPNGNDKVHRVEIEEYTVEGYGRPYLYPLFLVTVPVDVVIFPFWFFTTFKGKAIVPGSL